jgi:hypothetical protein
LIHRFPMHKIGGTEGGGGSAHHGEREGAVDWSEVRRSKYLASSSARRRCGEASAGRAAARGGRQLNNRVVDALGHLPRLLHQATAGVDGDIAHSLARLQLPCGSGRDSAAPAAKGCSAPRVAALVSPLLSLPLLLLLFSGSWWWRRIRMGIRETGWGSVFVGRPS